MIILSPFWCETESGGHAGEGTDEHYPSVFPHQRTQNLHHLKRSPEVDFERLFRLNIERFRRRRLNTINRNVSSQFDNCLGRNGTLKANPAF